MRCGVKRAAEVGVKMVAEACAEAQRACQVAGVRCVRKRVAASTAEARAAGSSQKSD